MSERTRHAPSNARWTQRPPHSNWGDFGPDDERGRLNLVTREKVLQGVAEVKEGLTFCLSLPLDYPGGMALSAARRPPRLAPTIRNGQPYMNYPMSRDVPWATDIVSDDEVTLSLQYSTQWDSLAHVGQMFDVAGNGIPLPVYYNGFRAGEDVAVAAGPGAPHPGARHLGVERMAEHGMQGRGVMIDLAAHYGGTARKVGYVDLMAILAKDGVVVEAGDFICLRTGFADMLLEMGGRPDREALMTRAPALDGSDPELLAWITASGLAALIADNFAVEALPVDQCDDGCCTSLPLHAHCLFALGIPLGELWHLGALAHWLRDHGRHRFLLTAPPLRLPGAVGSPATPIATV